MNPLAQTFKKVYRVVVLKGFGWNDFKKIWHILKSVTQAQQTESVELDMVIKEPRYRTDDLKIEAKKV